MKNKLFQKLFFTTTAAIVTSLLIMTILLSVSVNNYFVKEKEYELTKSCKTIAGVLSNETGNTENFYISLSGIVKVLSGAVTGDTYVCDAEGHIFHCSCSEWQREKTCVHSASGISESILNDVADGGFFEFGHFSGHFKNIYYTAGMPFTNSEEKVAGFVFISQPASQLQEVWSHLAQMFMICAIIPLALMFVFLFAATRRMIKPLKLMSEAAVKMADGDFSSRIPVFGDDEISELSEAFNKMSNSLSQLEGMRRSFIANVSHELRTPMTTIGGFIDGIIDGTISPEKQGHYLDLVSNEVKRLSRLVQSMLSLARLESGEQKVNYAEFNLKDLVFDVLLSQEQRIEEKSLDIKGLENGKDIKLRADRDLVYQAVFNLVDNAIKFSPNGEAIIFGLGRKGDGTVSFKIRNAGAGINPKELPFVFDRFYKTDRSRSVNKEGTGLGLYIVKTIVEIHKAHISVSSVPDQYTEFEIIFPK